MKLLILLMSCNNPLYEAEEQACKDTFLKEVKNTNIQYLFYKSTTPERPDQGIDWNTHTLWLNAPDDRLGTAKKTEAALEMTLPLEWDYVLKTNVSTYLNIERITKAIESWPGREDTNIYGASFLVNTPSKKTPFPRGHFAIIPRNLIEGALPYMKKLTLAKDVPRTDDTLLSLSLLYHIHKDLSKEYMKCLRETPSIKAWHDDIVEDPVFQTALSVRCKDERNPQDTPKNMLKLYNAYKENQSPNKFYTTPTYFETDYGIMLYPDYLKMNTLMEKIFALIPKKEKS